MKLQLEKKYWCQSKTVPVGILGTAEDAPIALIVTGTSLESAMQKAAEKELNKTQEHWSKIICRNWKS
jgi:HAE1 family hydrophobic/amphiphilic exporter-1